MFWALAAAIHLYCVLSTNHLELIIFYYQDFFSKNESGVSGAEIVIEKVDLPLPLPPPQQVSDSLCRPLSLTLSVRKSTFP